MIDLRSAILASAPLVFGLACGPAAAADAAADRVVNIALEDQFKNRHETLRYGGDVVVLVFAERKGAEAALELGRRLHVRFHPTATAAPATEWSRQPVVGPVGWPTGIAPPDVHVIPIACLPEVPKALEAVARSRFRNESPFVPVWLDFEDVMRQRFGIVPDEPNVVLLDTAGRPRDVVSGHLDEVRFAEVVAAVDQLRLQALQARSAAIPAAATAVR
ncbi:MAG: hypothetical protein FJ286_06375 [Planctomycetes bacterium]|nr:hypothetical protein [Planctomycetota bacterium]